MINTDNLEKAKSMIRNSQQKPLLILAQNDEFNRKILEYGKFDVLVDIESGLRKDSLRQLDSGLNHVLAKIASKNKVSVGIDLEKISGLNKREKAEKLSKIMQNIKICMKTGTKLKILNSKDPNDSRNLLLSLGASTLQAKKAIYF